MSTYDSDGSFSMITSGPDTGTIIDSKTNQVISRSAGEANEYIVYPKEEEFYTSENVPLKEILFGERPVYFKLTPGQGPWIIITYDSEGNMRFSTRKKINGYSSRWGSSETYYEIFEKGKGLEFLKHLPKNPDLSHNFMILSPQFNHNTRMYCDYDVRILYIGTVNLENMVSFHGSDYVYVYDSLPPTEDEFQKSGKLVMRSEFSLVNEDNVGQIYIFLSNGVGFGPEKVLLTYMKGDEKRNSYNINDVIHLTPNGMMERGQIIGTSPNTQCTLYRLFDDALVNKRKGKTIETYREKYPFLANPTFDQLQEFRESPNFLSEIPESWKNGDADTDYFARVRNIMMHFLLACSLHKQKEVIDYYNEYIHVRTNIKKFIMSNRQKISSPLFDTFKVGFEIQDGDKVKKIGTNEKGLARIRDIAKKAWEISQSSSTSFPDSLHRFLENETGMGLYRIKKLINFYRNNPDYFQES